MTPPQLPPAPLTWDSLPPARQQELTQLLAALLTQYLAAHKRQTTSPSPQESILKENALQENDHERTSQNP